jgi:hypothetical protein
MSTQLKLTKGNHDHNHDHKKPPKPTPIPTPTHVNNPVQILPQIKSFSLQLPISDKAGGSPISISNPGTYNNKDWFYVNKSGDAVQFVVDIDLVKNTGLDATTANSKNLRTELRESTSGWSLADKTLHTLEVSMSVDVLVGGGVVVMQVHGPGRLPNMELELKNGFFQVQDHKNAQGTPNSNIGNLNSTSYKLGDKVTIKVVCGNGLIQFYYNGTLSPISITGKYDGQYFKTGNYLQGQNKGEKAIVSIYSLILE